MPPSTGVKVAIAALQDRLLQVVYNSDATSLAEQVITQDFTLSDVDLLANLNKTSIFIC